MLVLSQHLTVSGHRQEVIAMPACLKANEEAIEPERRHRRERQLRRRELRSRRARGERRHHQSKRRQRRHRREHRSGTLRVERYDRATTSPGHNRQADDPVARDDHRGEHRVPRQRFRLPAASEHQRDDQRHFDDRHRHGKHERAVRLAYPMRDHLRVMHGSEHRATQEYRHEQREGSRHVAAPCQREDDRGEHWSQDGPGEAR